MSVSSESLGHPVSKKTDICFKLHLSMWEMVIRLTKAIARERSGQVKCDDSRKR